MRQLLVEAPRGHGPRLLDLARELGGANLVRFDAHGENGPCDLLLVHLPNRAVEAFLRRVDGDEVRVTLAPQGTMALHPPEEEAPDQVVEVEPRSPLEVFLSGLQSVGAWRGFLGYAAAAGVVTWIGLLTQTIYLLVAGMLIAPFAGPAMNAALATARGDRDLLRRSLLRYAGAIALSVAVAAGLSLAYRLEALTGTAVAVANLSIVAVLLPLTAGAAGALNLVQSERDSLVSGAAVGMLVAASLAPPAGVLGMALALREWGVAQNAVFLLALQLAGINLAGAAVFRLYAITPRGARYERGRPWLARAAMGATVVALAALVAWQVQAEPTRERATLEQRVESDVEAAVEGTGLARLVEARAVIPRAELPGAPALLVEAYVSPTAQGAALGPDELAARVEEAVARAIVERHGDVAPLVEVRVVAPPAGAAQR